MANVEVKLRGHHLLCVLTYIGRGYTEYFRKKFDAVVEQINNGAAVELVNGIDDICRGLHDDTNCAYADKLHCFEQSATDRDHFAIQDINQQMEMDLSVGSAFAIGPCFIKQARDLFQKNQIRTGCQNCQWYDICTNISAYNYDGVKLFPVSVAPAK